MKVAGNCQQNHGSKWCYDQYHSNKLSQSHCKMPRMTVSKGPWCTVINLVALTSTANRLQVEHLTSTDPTCTVHGDTAIYRGKNKLL